MPYPVYRAFISSTFTDLASERLQALQSVQDLNSSFGILGFAILPIDLQRGADFRPPIDVCLHEVRNSDVMITIVGRSYGSIDSSGRSFTEMEFDAATEAGIQKLAYYKNNRAFFLPEHIENDPDKIGKLRAFQKKIDCGLKRDTFANGDELRGHIMRDLIKWAMSQNQITSKIPLSVGSVAVTACKGILEKMAAEEWSEAASQFRSRKFKLEMQRAGLSQVFQALLRDLLEIGTLRNPSKIVEPRIRAKLLIEFIEVTNSVTRATAIEEAERLQPLINNPHFSFEVSQARVMSLIVESARFDLAIPHLKRMFSFSRLTRDPHHLGQARMTIGAFYAAQANHLRALRWFWKAINTFCCMVSPCAFCLSNAFIAAGNAHMSVGECVLANDRFAKALMCALATPSADRQARSLECLARHWTWHGELRSGVAAYVWLARLAKQHLPRTEEADLNLMLGEVALKHGYPIVAALVKEVSPDSERIVLEALRPFKIEHFIDQIGIQPITEDDGHWIWNTRA